jgi:hypothetical protein
MTFEEATFCFDTEFLSLWENWKPSDKEKSFWLLTLQKYEDSDIKKALYVYVQKYDLYKKPKLPLFLGIIRGIARGRHSGPNPDKEHNPLFWLVRQKDGVMKPIYGKINRNYSPDEIERLSQRTRDKWVEAYETNWIIIKSQDPNLDSKYPNHRYPVTDIKHDDNFFDNDGIEEDELQSVESASYEPNPDYVEGYEPPEDSEIPF